MRHKKQNILGQYFTPENSVKKCLDIIPLYKTVIEPSYGSGNFLKQLPENTIGIELDEELYNKHNTEKCINLNFYDYNETFEEVSFIGNPPYRTPAYSLTTHKDYIRSLTNKYNVKGLKEEAIFFILKTYDLIKDSKKANIGYVLPKSIFTASTKYYKSFHKFLFENLNIKKVIDIEESFEGVSQDLVFVYWEKGKQEKTLLYNNKEIEVEDFFGMDEKVIFYQDIFKKTSLGSVPAESIFLSCKDEPLEHFMKRLVHLFYNEVDENNVIDFLSYNGKPHLKALQNGNKNKIKTVVKYIKEVQEKFDIENFKNFEFYKPIRHRTEDRFYFRNDELKKMSFLYQLNLHTGYSFYFSGNPTSSSGDYFGFCEYDVNRNSSPAATRTVLVENIEENIHEGFLLYWKQNTNRPITDIFDYLMFVGNSKWFQYMKQKYNRFYFCIPYKFMKEWENEYKEIKVSGGKSMYLNKEGIMKIAEEARGIKKVDEITMTKESEEMADFTEIKIEEKGEITMTREEILRQKKELNKKLMILEMKDNENRKAEIERKLEEKQEALDELKDEIKQLKKEIDAIKQDEGKKRFEIEKPEVGDEIIIIAGRGKKKGEKTAILLKINKKSLKVRIDGKEKSIKYDKYVELAESFENVA